MSSKLSALLNIQKEILTTKLGTLSVMGQPTVVATRSVIFHLMIHQTETKVNACIWACYKWLSPYIKVIKTGTLVVLVVHLVLLKVVMIFNFILVYFRDL